MPYGRVVSGPGYRPGVRSINVAAAVAPVVNTASVVTGRPYVGSTLTATQTSWNNSPTSITRRWKSTDWLGNVSTLQTETASSFANASTYALAAATNRTRITYEEVATNSAGSTSSTIQHVFPNILPQLLSSNTNYTAGDSVAAGYNVAGDGNTDGTKAWQYVLLQQFGFAAANITNDAHASETLQNADTGQNQSGNLSAYALMVNNNNGITFNKKTYCFILSGGNDALFTKSGNAPTVANYTTKFTALLVACLTAGGYTRDQVFIGSMYHIDDTGLANTGASRTTFEQYVAAQLAVAQAFGVPMWDMYAAPILPANMINSDHIHPLTSGDALISQYALGDRQDAIVPTVPNNKPAVVLGTPTVSGGTATIPWTNFGNGTTGYDLALTDGSSYLDIGTTTATASQTSYSQSLGSGKYTFRIRAKFSSGLPTPWACIGFTV